MKGIFLALACAFALTSATDDSEIPVNDLGCPIDISIDWLLPHETYCDRFYSCVVGTPIPLDCPAQTAFDTEKQTCDWLELVDCGDRTLSVEENKTENIEEEVTERVLFGYDDPSQVNEICSREGSDDKLISHEDCNKYYQCVWGSYIVRQCPTNLYYNPVNGQCDWQSNVECTNVGVIDPDWSEAEIACSKGSALVPHEYCNWFYQCGPQGPIEKPCGVGTVFDNKIQTCNWPIYVNCGDKLIRPVESSEEAEEVDASQESNEEDAVTEVEEIEEDTEEVDDVKVELPDVVA